MTVDLELKELLEKQNKAFAEFREANDTRIKAVESKGWAPAELEQKVDTVNAEITRLSKEINELAKKANRPSAGKDIDPAAAEHKAALDTYLRKGVPGSLPEIQRKTMATYDNPSGGYFLTEEMEREIMRTVGVVSSFSGLAQTINGSAASYKKPVRTTGMTAAWRGEGDAPGATTGPGFKVLEFNAKEVDVYPTVTNESLEDLGFDVEGYIREEASISFGEAEPNAFLLGNGVNRPRGLLTYTPVANASYAWGSPGYVASGKSGAFADSDPADYLIDLIHALKAQYRNGASFLMNDLTLSMVRKFKDGQGQYLWQPGFQQGVPGLILGHPVYTDDNVPDIAADSYSIAFGNWARAYLIYRRRGMRIIRDDITSKGFTSFWITERVGGDVQNFEAFKVMKFAAS